MTLINSESEDQSWSPPDMERLNRGFAYYETKRPRTVCRTIVFKLHKPTRRKERALLWAQRHVTNMTAHILETLREEPDQLRSDGAFAVVLEMFSRKAQGQSGQRVQILADILSECFLAGKQRLPKQGATQKKQIIKRKPLQVTPLRPTDFPVTSVLRAGVFRQAALMLLNWYLRVVGEQEIEDGTEVVESKEIFPEGDPDAEVRLSPALPDLETVHALWSERCRTYEGAKRVVVPFGRRRGQTLEQAGKREVRWLQEHLISQETIALTLEDIAVLLDPLSKGERLRKAKQARHPWQRRANLQRAPRAGRLIERALDLPAPLVRLDTLNDDELQMLQTELEEMRDFVVEFDKIRDAVATFLEASPPSYPKVRFLLNQDEYEIQKKLYDNALTTLGSGLLSLEGEAELITSLLRYESALQLDEFQPLNFIRTMRPGGSGNSFALLYSKNNVNKMMSQQTIGSVNKKVDQEDVGNIADKDISYNYVLAVVLHGDKAFVSDQQVERFDSKVVPGLFYVNFPETPFVPPHGSSLILFPLECGDQYHEQTFLRGIIHQQRVRQHEIFAEKRARKLVPIRAKQLSETGVARLRIQRSGVRLSIFAKQLKVSRKPLTAAECFSVSAIASAKIISRETEEGFREFYLHTPIIEPAPKTSAVPDRVLGIHEHEDGYSYAMLDLLGDIIDAGNIFVPYHVRVRDDKYSYSNNYVFEVVKSIIEVAKMDRIDAENATLIGLEKTDYRKSNVHLSRVQNRRLFKRPSKKVAAVLRYKALLAGLPLPHMTWAVSPHRCSACGRKRPAGVGNTSLLTVDCPGCASTDLECSRCSTPSTHNPAALAAQGRPERTRSEAKALACSTCLEQHGYLSYELRCRACRHLWNPYEPRFHCPHCLHNQPARLNTAIVVAQLTLSQIALRGEQDPDARHPRRERKRVQKKAG